MSPILRDLMLGDVSPLTCRSYAFDLLRWHRLLWCLGIGWEKATEAEVAAMVGWLRAARNPQRERRQTRLGSGGIGEPQDGKAVAASGVCPGDDQSRPDCRARLLLLPRSFPGWPGGQPGACSAQRRQVLAHRSPLEPVPVVRRARLRQRVPQQAPRSIPDALWDELLAAMGSDRDRALLEFYVSSGARASELFGVTLEDVDWGGQLIYVVSKGTRIRQPVPASPDAFRHLGRYLAARRASCRRGTGLENPAR